MIKNYLEIKNVSFRAGGKTKVKNVSFNIENKGDIICLLGPSGVGKTTIFLAWVYCKISCAFKQEIDRNEGPRCTC